MEYKITVHNAGHTPTMVQEEADACLGISDLRLTLGHVMRLAAIRSPYLFGGMLDAESISAARKVIGRAYKPAVEENDLPPGDDRDSVLCANLAEFSGALQRELAAAWRGWEIIAPMEDGLPARPRAKSDIALYSPEWMADIIGNAARALPSLTYEEALWGVPLAMLIHLGDAEYRRQGGRTVRDHGEAEAVKELLRLRREWREKRDREWESDSEG